MNGYTLISFIGKGRIKDGKDGEYETTTYQFPDNGKKWKTSLFVEAILKTEYRLVKKVILVGTLTSSWDLLIVDRDNDSNADFFQKINDECKKNGLDESKKELESRLQGWYNIPFEIIVHTDKINRDNIIDIFYEYGKIPNLLEPNTDILFDITHGFRSMPLLVYQSLQLNVNLQKIFDRKVELIYGELKYGEISPVHDLSKYWEYYEISLAIKLFEEKLDGKLLAKKIKEHWESGAEVLISLSEIVECNFSLQIRWTVKHLNFALKNFSEVGKPQWVIDVKNILTVIYKRLSLKENEKYPVANIVWEYTKLLREKNFITQPVIALQVVVETAIAEKFASDKIGDYGWFNGYYDYKKSIKIEGVGEKKLKEMYKKSKKLGPSLGQLESLRNEIAHGGGKGRDGNFPHQATISERLKNVDSAIQELFTLLR